ncbi:MAG: uracil-DNA glycosylase family protein [Chthoniobacterales bacterium]
MPANRSAHVLQAAAALRDATNALRHAAPVAFTYNPLDYAWRAHEMYVRRYAGTQKRALFLGMNPGPFGMAQTGVPFGEVASVRDWLGLRAPIGKPAREHPKRLISGFDCARSEISGRRLWGLFAERFGAAEKFFEEHFVLNYCPLVFMETSGANRTPDKLPAEERTVLFRACDEHLRAVIAALAPEWIIGIGQFATERAQESLITGAPKIGRILHPSPASPAANKDWPGKVTAELQRLSIWE